MAPASCPSSLRATPPAFGWCSLTRSLRLPHPLADYRSCWPVDPFQVRRATPLLLRPLPCLVKHSPASLVTPPLALPGLWSVVLHTSPLGYGSIGGGTHLPVAVRVCWLCACLALPRPLLPKFCLFVLTLWWGSARFFPCSSLWLTALSHNPPHHLLVLVRLVLCDLLPLT